MTKIVRVAVIQARPVYYDLQKCLEKALDLIHDAHQQGAQLIAFGETWLPGYPVWLDYCPNVANWGHQPTKVVFTRLVHNSVTVPGAELTKLQEVAKQLQVVLVMSVNEKVHTGRGNGTIYNSLLTINENGELVNHHRKLRPTYTEQMVWGQGDGVGLKVAETAYGRVGGLICWEHWMPLTRQAMHLGAEEIHVAVWPTVHEMHQVASRHYAFEGCCFVLAAGNIIHAEDFPKELEVEPELQAEPNKQILFGGSAIIAPDGRYLVDPCFHEETILTADLNLDEIIQEKLTMDVTGHYARDDVFAFRVRDENFPR